MRVEKDLCNEIYKLNTQILSENFVLIIILIIVYIFLPKRHSSLQRAHKKSLLKKAATAEAKQVDGIPLASASLGSPAATASTNTTDHATDDVTIWTANVATEATATEATAATSSSTFGTYFSTESIRQVEDYIIRDQLYQNIFCHNLILQKVEIFQPDQMAKYFFQSLDICRNEKFANSIKDMPKWGQKTLKTVKGL